ncbi:MAG TPA: response regulator [Sporichthya sp.]|jgi:two-component system invasion response regulator UvrY|nr:response regulator [Sporichthya sp.]
MSPTSRASSAPPIGELPPAGIRVVLVDARAERRAVIRSVIEHSGVAVTVEGEAGDRDEALTAVEQSRADLVIVDLQEPVQAGMDTVAVLRARFPALVIVVASFIRGAAVAGTAMAQGANAYLLKPFTARDIVAVTRTAPPSALPAQSAVALTSH